MAALTGAVVAAGAAAYSANQQKKAAQGAANAQTQASNAAIGEQRAAREQMRNDLSPYMQAGGGALAQLQALNSGDMSSFKSSPDYQFALEQGIQGLDRSAAARGSLFSGGQQADLMRFGQGLATQNYNNYYSRLADLARMGQNSAAGVGSAGMGAASNIGNFMTGAGQAQANAFQQRADANSGLVTGLAGLANYGMNQYAQTARPSIGPVQRVQFDMPKPTMTVPNAGGY